MKEDERVLPLSRNYYSLLQPVRRVRGVRGVRTLAPASTPPPVTRCRGSAAADRAGGAASATTSATLLGNFYRDIFQGCGYAFPSGSGSRREKIEEKTETLMKWVVILISLKRLSKFGPAPWFSTFEQFFVFFNSSLHKVPVISLKCFLLAGSGSAFSWIRIHIEKNSKIRFPKE